MPRASDFRNRLGRATGSADLVDWSPIYRNEEDDALIIPCRAKSPWSGDSHTIWIAALPGSTVLSLPSAKNPICRLSADQNGYIALSVLARAVPY